MRSAFALMAAFLHVAAAAASPATETLTIRGRERSLRVYGARGGPAAVVAGGDGGSVHLGPCLAGLLASQGYFATRARVPA